jgi:hypothetical protein
MKIDIGDIFVIGIFALLAVALYLAVKFIKSLEEKEEYWIDQFEELDGKLTLIHGCFMKSIDEIAAMRRDFNLKFDNELAKKVSAVLAIGESTPEHFMKKFNPETKAYDLVEIDGEY